MTPPRDRYPPNPSIDVEADYAYFGITGIDSHDMFIMLEPEGDGPRTYAYLSLEKFAKVAMKLIKEYEDLNTPRTDEEIN